MFKNIRLRNFVVWYKSISIETLCDSDVNSPLIAPHSIVIRDSEGDSSFIKAGKQVESLNSFVNRNH